MRQIADMTKHLETISDSSRMEVDEIYQREFHEQKMNKTKRD